ncbi:MAG: imidazolonepropionase-like amidohydrolase [Candidatus Paceibacteria bacterium]|jgi:imidazolonepropionase-like amidohydrolase
MKTFHRFLSALGTLATMTVAGDVGACAQESGAGVALICSKALICELEGEQLIDNAVLLMKDGKIEAIGPRSEITIPTGYEVQDLGSSWIAPGMVGLHCHVGTPNPFFPNDINDSVYLTNPGLRASASTIASNVALARAARGGVTSVLFIPGSGTNMGGQGILLKTGPGGYDRNLIRNPGSLKLAQAGNPERWLFGPRRTFMNWNTRNTFKRGIAYAKRWEAFHAGDGAKPEHDPQLEIFEELYEKRTQVSTHTQIYQVVLMTVTMVRKELGLDVYIDHGTFDGYRAAGAAQEAGVPAILGPRSITFFPRFIDTDGKIQGVAAGYQQAGHTRVGFNTDSPIVPQEELFLQAAVGVRYGFDNTNLDHVRGLTIIPATAAGIAHRVGSLETGKDADIVVVSGDPVDPRSTVQMVFVNGDPIPGTTRSARH